MVVPVESSDYSDSTNCLTLRRARINNMMSVIYKQAMAKRNKKNEEKIFFGKLEAAEEHTLVQTEPPSQLDPLLQPAGAPPAARRALPPCCKEKTSQ